MAQDSCLVGKQSYRINWLKGYNLMYQSTSVESPDFHPSFVMTPLLELRRTLIDNPVPICNAIADAVASLSLHQAQIYLHISSHRIPSPYPTYSVEYEGMRYGTITHASCPPDGVSFDVHTQKFQQLAAECGDLLHFLDLVWWQRWQRSQRDGRKTERITVREREILAHCFAGYSRVTIARALHITPVTVKKHLSNLYEKLGVHSMQEALAVGRSAGLLLYLL